MTKTEIHPSAHSAFFPGKAIIIGDHALVHGAVGLALSLEPLGATLHLKPGTGQLQPADTSLSSFLETQWNWLVQQWGIEGQAAELNQYDLSVELTIPTSSGLGSSTAVTSSLFSAMASLFDRTVTKDHLFELVVAAESQQYPVSGIDQATCIFQGALKLQKTNQGFKWQRLSATAEQVLKDQTFFLVQSGQAAETTAEMVALYRQNRDQAGGLETHQALAQMSRNCIDQLEQGNWRPDLLQSFGDGLIKMGVVGATAQAMIADLQELGAVAKITAGGGAKAGSGALLAWHPEPLELETFIKQQNWQYWTV